MALIRTGGGAAKVKNATAQGTSTSSAGAWSVTIDTSAWTLSEINALVITYQATGYSQATYASEFVDGQKIVESFGGTTGSSANSCVINANSIVISGTSGDTGSLAINATAYAIGT